MDVLLQWWAKTIIADICIMQSIYYMFLCRTSVYRYSVHVILNGEFSQWVFPVASSCCNTLAVEG